ncbi:SMC-Scp complex subunit ScpB [Aestuariivirga sp.]|uniref:SMC-Scp complex subunit ScpB n=1 Tax=Aestuariivirga sp. TaxID=2650926 RepID=UPI003BA9441A
MQTHTAAAEAALEIEDAVTHVAPGLEDDVATEAAIETEAAAEIAGEEDESDSPPSSGMEDQPSATVTRHPRADRNQHLRIVEAILFATAQPVDTAYVAGFLPEGTDVAALLADLKTNYANRGVNLVEVAGKWLFRTADDLGYILRREKVEERKLSKAAMETLAIIAYHQPVTRAEIEDIRGVAISKGTLDQLLEIGWVRMRGRRKTPGRPVTYGTTEAFLNHFGLNEVGDLPGLQELKGAGLLDANLPPGFDIPMPRSNDDLLPDEEPLDGTETEQLPLEMHLPEQSDVQE